MIALKTEQKGDGRIKQADLRFIKDDIKNLNKTEYTQPYQTIFCKNKSIMHVWQGPFLQ